MALSNLKNEPRRELIEQLFGLLFFFGYGGWILYSIHLSKVLYHPLYCPQVMDTLCPLSERVWKYWADPGDFFITLGLSLGVWLIYPLLLFMHFLGEIVCGWMASFGFDPRPADRRRRW